MVQGVDGSGLPERIGGYAVERELGAGGMGTVYLARSRGGRAVAVKVARPELASDPHFRERFRAEVAAARSVGGFHTAPVVDADPDAAAPWLATAYIPGPTLSALIADGGPMDEARLRRLGAALAEALAAIHACGLVHRDLKPGNIIMAEDGPRVLDFGIARALESTRLTATGTAFGTPGFLAPEQAQGQEVGGAADVFALGAVLVAAAGGSAFGAGTPMGLMYRSVHEPPDLGAVPEGLRPAVAACLAKEPGGRPTPESLLDLFLPDPVAHPPTVALPPPPSYAPYGASPFGPPPHGATPFGPPPHGAAPFAGTPSAAAPYGAAPPTAGPYGAATPHHQAPTAPFSPDGTADDTADDAEPVFMAVDPRASVLIDASGVALSTDEHHLHVSWPEIGTVQYAPEGPKHLRVVVRLRDGAVHHCLLTARRRSRLQEWLEDLPLILECYL
ncbi:protein kinase domain-containing protein [Streptomyces zhihengii]